MLGNLVAVTLDHVAVGLGAGLGGPVGAEAEAVGPGFRSGGFVVGRVGAGAAVENVLPAVVADEAALGFYAADGLVDCVRVVRLVGVAAAGLFVLARRVPEAVLVLGDRGYSIHNGQAACASSCKEVRRFDSSKMGGRGRTHRCCDLLVGSN